MDSGKSVCASCTKLTYQHVRDAIVVPWSCRFIRHEKEEEGLKVGRIKGKKKKRLGNISPHSPCNPAEWYRDTPPPTPPSPPGHPKQKISRAEILSRRNGKPAYRYGWFQKPNLNTSPVDFYFGPYYDWWLVLRCMKCVIWATLVETEPNQLAWNMAADFQPIKLFHMWIILCSG